MIEILCESYPCTRKRHENTNYKSIATKFFKDKSRHQPAFAYCQDCYTMLNKNYPISDKRIDVFEELTYEEYLVYNIMTV